jgi:hypothetical protein
MRHDVRLPRGSPVGVGVVVVVGSPVVVGVGSPVVVVVGCVMTCALRWLDEWVASRQAIAQAFSGAA